MTDLLELFKRSPDMTGHGDTGHNSMLRKPFALGESLERIAEAERAA